MKRFILKDFTDMVKARGGSAVIRYAGDSPYAPGTVIMFPGEEQNLNSSAGIRFRVKKLNVELTTKDPNAAYKGRVGVLDVLAAVAAENGEWLVGNAEEVNAALEKGHEYIILTRGGFKFVKVVIREERNELQKKIIDEAFGDGFTSDLGNPFDGLIMPGNSEV